MIPESMMKSFYWNITFLAAPGSYLMAVCGGLGREAEARSHSVPWLVKALIVFALVMDFIRAIRAIGAWL